jgi:hypothetical protein
MPNEITISDEGLLDIVKYLEEWERLMADRKTPPAPHKIGVDTFRECYEARKKERGNTSTK